MTTSDTRPHSAGFRLAPQRITHGNCIEVMSAMAGGSVDFVLTDPPYITRYRDRDRRTVVNDDNNAWLDPAFAQMYRVLQRDAYAVSFYGWPKVDLFASAWRKAGFRIGGHIVFRKRYVSKRALLAYRHEQAYLLVKGTPRPPDNPPEDVIDWQYTGNKLHPTQKPVGIIKPLIRAFCEPGGTVLDPFAGSGSTLVAAAATGRCGVGIELDAAHAATASKRLQDFAARSNELPRAA